MAKPVFIEPLARTDDDAKYALFPRRPGDFSRAQAACYIAAMLNNRRRMTEAEFRRARRKAGFSSLFALKPPQIVIMGFVLAGTVMIVAREFVPHPWPGACYDAHFESRGGRYPGMVQVCLKHIPFADTVTAAPAG